MSTSFTGPGGVLGYRADVFANRGSASSFPGAFFFATDDPVASTGTLYYSDGSTWTAISGTKTEIGRATLTSNGPNTSSTTISDVTGLSISFTLATARAVLLEAHLFAANDTSSKYITMLLTDGSNTQLQSSVVPTPQVSANLNNKVPPLAIMLDLAAGSYTYKVRQQAPTGGIVHVFADATDPAFIRATVQ